MNLADRHAQEFFSLNKFIQVARDFFAGMAPGSLKRVECLKLILHLAAFKRTWVPGNVPKLTPSLFVFNCVVER
jgi:hypothetical protein